MTKTCRRWRRRCSVSSRWCSAKLMDSPSDAADEEPAAASTSADSTARKKHRDEEELRYPRVSEAPSPMAANYSGCLKTKTIILL